MPLATREIKRRIRSVSNTRKITKAMELVAGAKMRRAVKAVLQTRSYATAAWEIVKDLSDKTDNSKHPLLQKREKIKKVGIILISSNRGLCGSFNREIVELVANYINGHRDQNIDIEAEIFLMGNRGKDIMFRHGHKVIAEFTKFDVATRVSEVSPLAQMAIQDYISGKYDKIVMAYTDYKSAIVQEPRIRKLLPIDRQDDELGFVGKNDKSTELTNQVAVEKNEYIFEPSPDIVLEQMLNRLVELQIYQALLESNASEHSARMMAMRNASDAALDMINDLTITYNRARQQNITTELADISAGRAAVE